MSKENIYAVYKGDEFIDLGTKKELAKKLNLKPSSVHFLSTPTYRKRIKDISNSLIVIRIDDDDENE